jgi:hypothetical protein
MKVSEFHEMSDKKRIFTIAHVYHYLSTRLWQPDKLMHVKGANGVFAAGRACGNSTGAKLPLSLLLLSLALSVPNPPL